MLSTVLDVFRLRQYFDVAARVREVAAGISEDTGFLNDARRAIISLPFDPPRPAGSDPFPAFAPFETAWGDRRVALLATGGSGALASVVGAARALEEGGMRPSAISVCSGSALFGFPIAAGIPSGEVAAFTRGLRPEDYVDVGWSRLLALLPTVGRGFAGVIRGEKIEETYHQLVGDMTLAEMPIPAYAPIWNIEENRLEYIGPRTHPDMTVARAVRMAIALPLFIDPVELDGGYWCDGGIVDIFPVRSVLDIEGGCDVALAINGFYPPEFKGEDASGWEDRAASILYVASQVRTCQQTELARTNLRRLREASEVLMIEPVPYDKVRGVGFYRQFLDPGEWGEFMRAGRLAARRVLAAPRTRVRARA